MSTMNILKDILHIPPFKPKGDPITGLRIREGGEYSLFLQRCIEGINKQSLNHRTWTYIETTINQIVVFDGEENYRPFECDSIDQAKEQAIKHILEQIK